MKPTAADFRFWEAHQARHVPSWVRTIDAKRTWHAKRYDARSHIADHLHAAINARAGWKCTRNALDTQNAMVMLAGWADQLRRYGYTYAGAAAVKPRTLRDSIRCSLRDYGYERARNPRGPTWARILRRMEKRT